MLFFVYIVNIIKIVSNIHNSVYEGCILFCHVILALGSWISWASWEAKASISVWRAVETQGARPANLETKFDGKNRSNLMLFPGLNRSWNDYEMFKGQLTSGCRNHALGVHHSAEWSWEWSEVWILILHDIAVLLALLLLHTSQIFDMSNVQLTTAFLLSDRPLWNLAELVQILLLFVDSARAHLRSAAFSSSDKFLASCSRAHLTNSFVCNTMFFTKISFVISETFKC